MAAFTDEDFLSPLLDEPDEPDEPDESDEPDEPDEPLALPESPLDEPLPELSLDFSEPFDEPSADEPFDPLAEAAGTVLGAFRLSVR